MQQCHIGTATRELRTTVRMVKVRVRCNDLVRQAGLWGASGDIRHGGWQVAGDEGDKKCGTEGRQVAALTAAPGAGTASRVRHVGCRMVEVHCNDRIWQASSVSSSGP